MSDTVDVRGEIPNPDEDLVDGAAVTVTRASFIAASSRGPEHLSFRLGTWGVREQGGGRIINIASIAGLVPLRLQCAFAAAKGGVVNLTRAMAIELGRHNILVNGIAPGSTLTEGTRQLYLLEIHTES